MRGALFAPRAPRHAGWMMLPFSPGDRVKWNGKTVTVLAVNNLSVAIREPDGLERLVNLNALMACQSRHFGSKKGGAA